MDGLNAKVKRWFSDPEFAGLDEMDQRAALESYFDTELVADDEEFTALAEPVRAATRRNFADAHLRAFRPATSRSAPGDLAAYAGRGAIGGAALALRAGAGALELSAAASERGAGADEGYGPQEAAEAPEPQVAAVLRHAAGGVRRAAETVGDWRDMVLPESQEARAKGWRRTWTQGVESAVTSLAAMAPGAAVGLATGGTGLVPVVAGMVTGVPAFGLSQYDEALERYQSQGLSREAAQTPALIEGASEVAFEAATDIADLMLMGTARPLTRAGKAVLKESVQELIGLSMKESGKRAAKIWGVETAGETANAAVQTATQAAYGPEMDDFWGQLGEQLGPIMVSSAIFGGLGGGIHYANARRVNRLLAEPAAFSGDAGRDAALLDERLAAVEVVGEAIARRNPALARQWMRAASVAVRDNGSIDTAGRVYDAAGIEIAGPNTEIAAPRGMGTGADETTRAAAPEAPAGEAEQARAAHRRAVLAAERDAAGEDFAAEVETRAAAKKQAIEELPPVERAAALEEFVSAGQADAIRELAPRMTAEELAENFPGDSPVEVFARAVWEAAQGLAVAAGNTEIRKGDDTETRPGLAVNGPAPGEAQAALARTDEAQAPVDIEALAQGARDEAVVGDLMDDFAESGRDVQEQADVRARRRAAEVLGVRYRQQGAAGNGHGGTGTTAEAPPAAATPGDVSVDTETRKGDDTEDPEVTFKTARGAEGVTRYTFRTPSGAVVGTARLLGETIGDIEVKEAFRGRGYGRAVLRVLIQRGGRSLYAGSEAGAALARAVGMREEQPGRFVVDTETRKGDDTAAGRDSVSDEEFADMVRSAALWRGAARQAAALMDGDRKAQLAVSRQTTKGDLDAWLMREFDVSATVARQVSNHQTDQNVPDDPAAHLVSFQGEPWADEAIAVIDATETTLEDDREALDAPPADLAGLPAMHRAIIIARRRARTEAQKHEALADPPAEWGFTEEQAAAWRKIRAEEGIPPNLARAIVERETKKKAQARPAVPDETPAGRPEAGQTQKTDAVATLTGKKKQKGDDTETRPAAEALGSRTRVAGVMATLVAAGRSETGIDHQLWMGDNGATWVHRTFDADAGDSVLVRKYPGAQRESARFAFERAAQLDGVTVAYDPGFESAPTTPEAKEAEAREFANALALAADSIAALRPMDVHRVLAAVPRAKTDRLAGWLAAEIYRAQKAGRLALVRGKDLMDAVGAALQDLRANTETQKGDDAEPRPVAGAAYVVPGRGPETADTSRGMSIDYEWAVVEASDLVASHAQDFSVNPAYPQELQPRDRGRDSYQLQVHGMAKNLKPAALQGSAWVSDGAPLVGPDLVVESGNGRTLAIREAYRIGTAAGYRAMVEGLASGHGKREPVLVRLRTTELSREERLRLVHEANASGVAAMGPKETALADAGRLGHLDDLDVPENGDLNAARNRAFVRRFLAGVPAAERNALTDDRGMLSQAGLIRMRNAIFAAAYQSPEMVGRMAESTDNNVRNLTNGMLQAAPAVAKMQMDIAAGKLYAGADIAGIVDTVDLYADLRSRSLTVDGELKRGSLFGDRYTPDQESLLRYIEDDAAKSAKRFAGYLREYVNQVERQGDKRQQPLFDGARIYSHSEMQARAIERARKEHDERLGQQPGLFDAQPSGGTPADVRNESGAGSQQDAPGGNAEVAGGGAPRGGGKRGGKRSDATATLTGKKKRSGKQPAADGYEEFLGTDAPAPLDTETQKHDNKEAQNAAKPASGAELVSDARAEEIRARMRAKMGRLHMGVDPEFLALGAELTVHYVEKGVRRFADYARKMIADFGEAIRPYLKGWYYNVRSWPGLDTSGMDGYSEVEGFDVGSITAEESDATDSDADLEQSGAPGEDGLGEEVVRDGRGGTPRGGRSGVRRPARAGSGPRGGRELSGAEAAASGAGSDSSPHAVPPGTSGGDAGSELGERGGAPGLAGPPLESVAATALGRTAPGGLSLADKRAAQKAAQDVAVELAVAANIDQSLPFLTAGQRGDVLFAEKRFGQGRGVLFTNGTGTGKTFTGLGVIKRFERQGRDNIIVVVPSDKIKADWIGAAKNLHLDIRELKDTKDNGGRGIVVTTYANFGQNNELVRRKWDLVVMDEAHYLCQSKEGAETAALSTLRALTMHRRGAYARARMLFADLVAKLDSLKAARKDLKATHDMRDDEIRARQKALDEQIKAASREWDAAWRGVEDEVRATGLAAAPRVTLLSATPFAYEKTTDLAEGYLFDYIDADGAAYNSGDGRDRFMMQHFGWRMRVNKLTEPDADVDRGLMQRSFNSHLKKAGALSGRMLEVEHDYDRKFVLIESALGQKIDAALGWLRDKDNPRMHPIHDHISKHFDHLQRRFTLEAIKAKEVIPLIREHVAMGRKVVVFHDFKKGGTWRSPFDLSGFRESQTLVAVHAGNDRKFVEFGQLVREYEAERPDIASLPLAGLPSPVEALTKAFGDDLVVYNGDVPDRERLAAVPRFQEDGSGVNIILVSAAGKEGISLHDTTGRHPRVLFNLGLPTQPTTAIQQEGRIFRVGQASNAMFRYLNTGTSWERWAFAQTIAERASTAENLALGEEARALRDAFVEGFNASDGYPPGHEGEGTGGKSRDAAANAALSAWDRAVGHYFGQQRRTSRTKSAEGTDYYATPEPVGLKMMEWAGLRPGDQVLEPSAGHGAIARWAPENAHLTAVEPSNELAGRLQMVVPGGSRLVVRRFEDLNIINKYDAIVMNPPFGLGGKTAYDHLEKAAGHLRDGGRIVALVPEGPAADKRLEKFQESEAAKHLYLRAQVSLPAVTFERAGTQVRTKILIFDKTDGVGVPGDSFVPRSRDLTDFADIRGLFAGLADMEMPERVPPPRREVATSEPVKVSRAAATAGAAGLGALAKTTLPGDGKDVWAVKLTRFVPRATYTALNDQAKRMGGRYGKLAAGTGFVFSEEARANEFLKIVNAENREAGSAEGDTTFSRTFDSNAPDAVEGEDAGTDGETGAGAHQSDADGGGRRAGRWADARQAGRPAYGEGLALSEDDERRALDFLRGTLARYTADHGLEGLPDGSLRAAALSDDAARTVREIAAVYGRSVVFVRNASGFGFDGVTSGARPDLIFINAAAEDPHLTVVGHELVHHFRRDYPDLYLALRDALAAMARDYDGFRAQYLAKLSPKEREAATAESIAEEFTGDMVGSLLLDQLLWTRLNNHNPGLFGRIARAVSRFLTDLWAKLSGGREATAAALADRHLADIDQARRIVADALNGWRAERERDLQRAEAALAAGEPVPPAMSRAGLGMPIFYSELRAVVRRMLPGRGTAAQMRAAVAAWGKKGLFRAEELAWSGLDEWLAAQGERKLTRDEVDRYLAENTVTVQELVKDEHPSDSSESDEEWDVAGGGRGYRYAQYATEGAAYYRELLLTLPEKPSPARGPKGWGNTAGGTYDPVNYLGPHWDEPNVLAHVRFNEQLVDGRRTLYIEEVQSDWHQEGRRHGYSAAGPEAAKVAELQRRIEELRARPADEYDSSAFEEETRLRAELAVAEMDRAAAGVPDAPFKSTWPLLAMKRMVRWAAEHGYEQVAWAGGALQAERYRLAKQVSEIVYDDAGLLQATGIDGQMVINRVARPDQLDGLVGKEIAARLREGKRVPYGTNNTAVVLSGVDLKVGGEGMAAFYDGILPNEVGKYVKRWGARVTEGRVATGWPAAPGMPFRVKIPAHPAPMYTFHDSRADAERQMALIPEEYRGQAVIEEHPGARVHVFPVTDAMAAAAMAGQPLFRRPGLAAPVTGQAATRDYEKNRGFVNRLFEQRDVGMHRARVIAAGIQTRIQALAGPESRRRHVLGFAYRKEKRSAASDLLDQALHVWRDLQAEPGKEAEYRAWAAAELAKPETAAARRVAIGRQLAILDRAARLTAEEQQVAHDVGALYDRLYQVAEANGVIKTHRDNYVRRLWRLDGRPGGELPAVFKVSTGAARARSLDTILDGWMAGYDLAVSGLSTSYGKYHEELEEVLANRDFVRAGYATADAAGRRLFSSSNRGAYKGYERLSAPGFHVWEWAGKSSVALDDPDAPPALVVDDHGRKFFSAPVERIPEAWAVHSVKKDGTVSSRAVRVFESRDEAEDWLARKPWQGTIRYRKARDVEERWERRELYAPAPLARLINRATARDTWFSGMPAAEWLLDVNARLKSWILLSSFFHHMAGVRSWVFAVNHGWRAGRFALPGGQTVEAGGWNPVAAYKRGLAMVEGFHPLVTLGVRHGLSLGEIQTWSEGYERGPGLARRLAARLGLAGVERVMGRAQAQRESWEDSLFKKFFAGLKAHAFVVEYAHLLQAAHQEHLAGRGPAPDADRLAERVARLINEDFGGLHLARMGRHPTLQKLGRLLLLAVDWTESNFRMVTGLVPGLNDKISDLLGETREPEGMRPHYRAFFGRVLARALLTTLFIQLLLNGWDESLEFWAEQMRGGNWRKFRWLGVDLSRLYRMFGVDPGDRRPVFSVVGHFADPLKLLDPVRLAKGKGSPLARAALAWGSGSDWQERPFTSAAELFSTGKTVKESRHQPKEGSLEALPSVVLNQALAMQPIQVGNFIKWLQGEEDGLTMLLASAGTHVSYAWPPKLHGPVAESGAGHAAREAERLVAAGVLTAGPPTRTMTVDGVPGRLSEAEYALLVRESAAAVEAVVARLVASGRWDRLAPEAQAAVIEEETARARKAAREKIRQGRFVSSRSRTGAR